MRRVVAAVKGLGAAAVAMLAAQAASADEWARAAQSDVRLIEGSDEAGGTRMAALEFRLRPGWKTYWRAPGEAGIPPSFDFSGSENVASVELIWPRPHVFDNFGYQSIGYTGSLVVPLKVTPADPAAPVRLTGALFWGVCSDICVPEEARVDLALDGVPTPGAEEAIAAAAAAAPDRLGPDAAACRVAGAGAERAFSATLRLDPPLDAPPLVVVEGPEEAWFGPTSSELKDGELLVAGPVEVASDNLWIDRSQLRLTVLAGARAVEIAGCGAGSG